MATIYDIAKASGVSATTVSHVLNRTRYVSPEVTSRVMDAVEDLGYEPLRQRKKSNDMSQVIYALSDFLIMILSWLVKQSLRAFLFQEVQP